MSDLIFSEINIVEYIYIREKRMGIVTDFL